MQGRCNHVRRLRHTVHEEGYRRNGERREKQIKYNEEHGITPRTIIKDVRDLIEISREEASDRATGSDGVKMTAREREEAIKKLEKEMAHAAKMLEFEYAAVLRDRIIRLRSEK